MFLFLFLRYNEETGVVTITTDRCPYRGQNMDYASYLMNALYHESWKVEDWEVKEVEDLEIFPAEERGGEREALEQILNKGEDEEAVRRYSEEVRKLLELPPPLVKGEIMQ